MKKLAWLVPVAFALGCGGGGGGTFVVVHIERGSAPTAGIKKIDLQLMLGGASVVVPIGAATGPDLELPTTKGLEIGSGTGTMMITVVATDSAGTEVARGTGTVAIVRDDTVDVTVTLGAPAAMLAIDKTTHDYGNVIVGTPSSTTFLISNRGSAATGALTGELTGTDAASFMITSNGCQGMTLTAGGSCQIVVSMAPTSAGAKAATLSVGGTPGGTVSANLSGTAQTPGAITVMPATRDFGMVVVGQSSADQVFTLTNSGTGTTGAITTVLSGTDAAQFAIAADTCAGQTLAAQATCMVTVHMSPTSSGNKSASLSITAAPGGPAGASLTGTAVPPGLLMISPGTHNFGMVEENMQSGTQTFTITNGGGAATGSLGVMVIGVNNNQFMVVTDGCSGMTLAAAASCAIVLRMAPTSPGAKTAMLQVSGTPGGLAAASLSGTGLGRANLMVSPTTHDFSTIVIGNNSTVSVVVTNTGGVPSGVPMANLSGADAASYMITSNSCTAAVAPSANCQIQVRFQPASAGIKMAMLTINATPGGGGTVMFSGTAVSQGDVRVAPLTHDFLSVVVGQASTAQTFTVTNMGGAATGTLTVSLTGTDMAHFAIGTNTCMGQTLAAAGTCSVSVTFMPTVAGPRNASLVIQGNPGGITQASLTGTGLTPPALSLTPATLVYPDTVIGANQSQQFTVMNTGGGTSGAVNVNLSGAGAAQYSIQNNNCSGMLAGGASCSFQVRFQPSTSGNFAGMVTASAAPGGSAMSTFSGRGMTAANLTRSPATLAFGSLAVGASSPLMTLTLTNSGEQPTGPITLAQAGSHPGDFPGDPQFMVGDCQNNMVLMGGQSCTGRFQFTPTASGARSATLSASASPGNTVMANLTGTGFFPAKLVSNPGSPATLTFPTQEVGTTSPAQTWQITNTGDVASGTLSLLNDNQTEFPTNSTCGVNLGPGASCNITVSFSPGSATPRTANMTISAGASGGGTVSLTASGTGGYRLTVSIVGGTPAGRRVFAPAGGIDCGSTCSALYPQGSGVDLRADTFTGSNLVFNGWSQATCIGPNRNCLVPLSQSTTVTATFVFNQANLVFVSSPVGFLGSAAAYDTECQSQANTAGLTGNFGAWTSDSSSRAMDRISAATNGFVRMDGKPFGTQIFRMVDNGQPFDRNQIYYPVRFDAFGRVPADRLVITGTTESGQAAINCNNWTGGGTAIFGQLDGGAGGWTATHSIVCQQPGGTMQIYCMQRDNNLNVQPPPPPPSARRLFLQMGADFMPGSDDPDNTCRRNGSGQTLLAYLGAPAAEGILDGDEFYRPDGVFVGTGAQIKAGGPLEAAITVTSNGDNIAGGLFDFAWTGAPTPILPGDPMNTCMNWLDPTGGSSGIGNFGQSSPDWWRGGALQMGACVETHKVYCYF